MKIVLVEVSVQAPDTFTGSDEELVTFAQNEVTSALGGRLTPASGDTLRVLSVDGIEVTHA